MKRIALGAIPPRTDTPSGACCKGIKGLFRRHLTAGNQFLVFPRLERLVDRPLGWFLSPRADGSASWQASAQGGVEGAA